MSASGNLGKRNRLRSFRGGLSPFLSRNRRLILVLISAFTIQFLYRFLFPFQEPLGHITRVSIFWDPGWFRTVPFAYSKLAVEQGVLPYEKPLPGYPFETLEYPFLMGYFFYALYLISAGSFDQFVSIFQLINMSFQTGIAGLIYLLLVKFKPSNSGLAIPLLYVATPAVLFFAMSRYDPIPGFFTLLSVYLFVSKRQRAAFAVMGIGILTKIYPALLALVYLKHGLQNRRPSRYYVELVAIPATVMLVGLIPLALTNPAGFLTLIVFLGGFGWNWESIYGPIDQFLRPILPQLAFIYLNQVWMRVPFVLACLSVLLLDLSRENKVILGTAYAITAWMQTQWFFSPQYFVWIAPFMLFIFPTFPGLALYLVLALVMTLEMPSPFYFLVPMPEFYYFLTIYAVRWLILLGFMLILVARIQRETLSNLRNRIMSYWARED